MSTTTVVRSTLCSALGVALLSCGSAVDAGRPPVAAVRVTPPTLRLALGSVAPLQAIARSAAGDDLHDRQIFWTSSDTAVATVSGAGVVTALAIGTAVIAASSEGESGTAAITVTPPPVASVAVLPATVQTTVGSTVQLQAVTYDELGHVLVGRTINWSSDDPRVAAVDDAGAVRAVAAGSATITATSEGRSGSAEISVLVPVDRVQVQPSSTIVSKGGTVQLTARTYDADGNELTGRPITWGSSDQSVATVNESGLVTGVAEGSARISATAEGRSGSASVLVSTLLFNSRTSQP